MSFQDSEISFQVFYPNLLEPSSALGTAVVGSGVEFPDISGLDVGIPGLRVINADVDVGSDTIKITMDETFGQFLVTPGFNGYKIADVDGSIDPIAAVTIVSGPTALPVNGKDIFFSENAVFIDLDGLTYAAGSTVEVRVEFGDPEDAGKSVPFDVAAVARLYEAAFGRVPDDAGLNYWIDVEEDGTSIDAIAAYFLGSEEFAETFGQPQGLSDDALVSTLYENILDRQGEAAGIDYWVGQLASNAMTREHVLAQFAVSAENVAGTGYIDNLAQNLSSSDWIVT